MQSQLSGAEVRTQLGGSMGWRWRRSIRIGPFRWNLSKSGVGVSWGIPGFRYGVSSSGRKYISIGIPGTGLYFFKYLGSSHQTASNQLTGSEPSAEEKPWWTQDELRDP